MAKETYRVDHYVVSLTLEAEILVDEAVYWTSLFAHTREKDIWKGILLLDLGPNGCASDEAAARMLGAAK